ncbi:MAG: hypothetical protein M3441_02460 [Chloroflexota bacterium]|nr:hypothetical protein [Chloroflexota bacterium]
MQMQQNLVPAMRRRVGIFLTMGALLLGTTFAIGCVAQDDGSSGTGLAQATTAPSGTETVLPAATTAATGTPGTPATTPSSPGTSTPAVAATTTTTTTATSATGTAAATETVSVTDPVSATATVVEGTPTPRPTPEGPAPEPEDQLDMYGFFPGTSILVRRDLMQLDGTGPNEVLYSLTGPDPAITTEFRSNVNVLTYDTVYREWLPLWASDPVSGTATPLLSVAQAELGGLNGGDLLRTGAPVFILRTTTADSRAHLFLYRWDAVGSKADPLRMVPVGGGAEQNAAFTADLDLNVADLDDDGIYEVVADNVAGVQVWKWDGQKYVPEVAR